MGDGRKRELSGRPEHLGIKDDGERETDGYLMDESDDRQKRTVTNWRGLCPEMDREKLKMMIRLRNY